MRLFRGMLSDCYMTKFCLLLYYLYDDYVPLLQQPGQAFSTVGARGEGLGLVWLLNGRPRVERQAKIDKGSKRPLHISVTAHGGCGGVRRKE